MPKDKEEHMFTMNSNQVPYNHVKMASLWIQAAS
jgi:hypothetical protein